MFKRLILVFILVSFFTSPLTAGASTLLDTEFSNLVKSNALSKSKQAFCISSGEEEELSLNIDARVIPASVSKLYTFDFALSELPPDFRYQTEFFVIGETLYINGGGDPHFVIENLRGVVKKVYDKQGVKLSKFVFSPDFYFNWKKVPSEIKSSIVLSLKEKEGGVSEIIAKDFTVESSTKKYKGKGQKYVFQSVPLPMLMKQISNYSNNIASDVLFARLGGSEEFSKYMEETYGASKDEIYFKTGSGLYGNYTTCDLTLKVIKHLEEQLASHDIELTDVMTLPVIDAGVLQDRSIKYEYARAMVAKSGYVNNHHALAGIINTKDEPKYFAVFTYFDTEKKNLSTKKMIDTFMNKVSASYSKLLKPFNYKPSGEFFEKTKIVAS